MTIENMKKEPLISVLLPVYNGAPFLAGAIDSILKQTLNDFELIVINDGSTDDSLSILKHYESLDPRVKVFSRPNRGLANTLNESIELARGAWIARMDQDDIAHPTRFETQLNYLISSGADIAGTWVKRFGAADNRTVRLPQSDAAIKIALLFESPFAHPTVMMKAESIKKLGYEHTWDKAEDYDLWVRAAISGWKMMNVPEVLLDYRVHSSQISTSAAMVQMQLSQGIRKKYWQYLLASWGCNTSCVDELLKTRSSSRTYDFDQIDAAIGHVLDRCEEEARILAIGHARKIYFRIASDCPNVVTRWRNICKRFSIHSDKKTELILGLLHTFKLKPESKIFIGLRATLIYFKK